MRLVPAQSLEPHEVSSWVELAKRAAEPNPFFEPAFVVPAVKHLDTAPPYLLVHEHDGAWIGCLPVRVTRLLGCRIALSTWRHPYSYIGTPLVDRRYLTDFADALVQHLGDWRNGRFLMLRRAVDGAVVGAIRSAVEASRTARMVFDHTAGRAAVRRRSDPDEYLGGLKPRRLRQMERRRERLADQFDGVLMVTDRPHSPDAVEEFLRLEASGWKGKEGTAMATSGDAEFFRSICREFAQNGRLQLLSLEAEQRALAMQCNISASDILFNFKIAFDEELRSYAPGIQLEIDAIRAFHEERHEGVMDSCAEPDNEVLNRLWPDRIPIATLVVGPGGPIGRVASRALASVHARRVRKRDSQ
jgi:CelD/BcsL family acetyltransferase involved in cellulose biosynthesis